MRLDLRSLNDETAWRRAFPHNYALLVTDVPWETVAGNTNKRTNKFASITNSDLLRMARNGWAHAFTPSEREPVGLAWFWCTSDSHQLACQALSLAGYKLLHTATWLKTTAAGEPHSYRAMAKSNMETVVVGIKGKRPKKNRTHYVDRCFQGNPYATRLHSSKPLAFFEYVRWFVGLFFRGGELDYDACKKLDLFSRYATEGWTSAGNEFIEERQERRQERRQD